MNDLDAQVEQVLDHHQAEAKRKAAADVRDPHVMQKTIGAVFARVDRQRELDDGSVVVKSYEC